MTTALISPPPKSLPDVRTYAKLRDQVRKIFLAGRKRAMDAVKAEGTQTAWEAGKLVEVHVQFNKPTPAGRAAYGEEIVKQLADDLGENTTTLYVGWELARSNPNFAPAQSLSLSHQRLLLPVKDPKLRNSLAEEAEKKGWGKRELAWKIASLKKSEKDPAKKPPRLRRSKNRFIPKRGRLDTYQIIARGGSLSLNLGFRTPIKLSPVWAKGLREGDIVETKPGLLGSDPNIGVRPHHLVKLPHATKKDIYAYRARVTKVIDADTYWMDIDIGLPVWRDDKLRLRGVNAPEIHTKAGKRAKKFVEEMFEKYPKIEITTTKPDKWDRYLSDVWLSSDGKDWLNLNKLLLEKGYATLKTKWSLDDWDVE